MSAEPMPPAGGPVASLRALAATVLELIGTRAELALVELREEGERRKQMLALAAVSGVFLLLGLLLAAFLVIVIFWETHRVAATAAVTALYLGIAVAAFLKLRSAQREAPPPFEATMRELALDRELLRGGHGHE